MSSPKRPDLVIFTIANDQASEPAITGLKTKQNKNLSYQTEQQPRLSVTNVSPHISHFVHTHETIFIHVRCRNLSYLTTFPRKPKLKPNSISFFFFVFECIVSRDRNICALMNGRKQSTPFSVKAGTFVIITLTPKQNSTNLEAFR